MSSYFMTSGPPGACTRTAFTNLLLLRACCLRFRIDVLLPFANQWEQLLDDVQALVREIVSLTDICGHVEQHRTVSVDHQFPVPLADGTLAPGGSRDPEEERARCRRCALLQQRQQVDALE